MKIKSNFDCNSELWFIEKSPKSFNVFPAFWLWTSPGFPNRAGEDARRNDAGKKTQRTHQRSVRGLTLRESGAQLNKKCATTFIFYFSVALLADDVCHALLPHPARRMRERSRLSRQQCLRIALTSNRFDSRIFAFAYLIVTPVFSSTIPIKMFISRYKFARINLHRALVVFAIGRPKNCRIFSAQSWLAIGNWIFWPWSLFNPLKEKSGETVKNVVTACRR